jgi:hypothetical protein
MATASAVVDRERLALAVDLAVSLGIEKLLFEGWTNGVTYKLKLRADAPVRYLVEIEATTAASGAFLVQVADLARLVEAIPSVETTVSIYSSSDAQTLGDLPASGGLGIAYGNNVVSFEAVLEDG